MNLRSLSITFILAVAAAFNTLAQDNNELFWKAARVNDVNTLKAMLDKGFDVNTMNHYGLTALSFAVDKGNVEAVNFLLDHGANPNQKDSFYNETLMGWAIYKKNKTIILSLISHGADIKDENMVANAAGTGLTDVVKQMLDKGAPGAGNVLMISMTNGDSAMFEMALPYSLKNDSILSDALVTATGLKNDYFINNLVKAGAKLPPADTSASQGKIDENLAGTYATPEGYKIEMAFKDDALTASFDGSQGYRLQYKNDSTLKFTEIPGITMSVRKAGGKITAVILNQPERSVTFLRSQEKDVKKTELKPVEEDLIAVASPANWPAFRGTGNSGLADGQHPPVTWDASTGKNLLWRTYIPGLAHASPVIWGDKVFVITAQSSDTAAEYRVGLFGDVEPANDTSSHIWKIYCIDRNKGKILWEKKAFEGIPRVKRHVKGSQANATPVTNGKYVVALFGSEGMVCYDFKGNEIWRKDLGVIDAGWFFNEETEWGPASSPVIYKNTVILQCDRSKNSFIAAWDLETGNEAWKTPREEISSWGTPTPCHGSAGDELVTNATRFIRSYDPANGHERWRLAPNSEITVGTPVSMDSLVYVTAGYPPVQPVYAIRLGGSGDISIADSANSGTWIKWRKKRGGTYMPSPIVYNGYLYTLSNSGSLICYDALTGEIKYKETIKNGGAFSASPLAADGKLYCTSEEKGVFVIRAGAEYDLITSNPIGEICMATPAISNGMIFIRGQHHLYCFGVRK